MSFVNLQVFIKKTKKIRLKTLLNYNYHEKEERRILHILISSWTDVL